MSVSERRYLVTVEITLMAGSAAQAERIVRDAVCDVADDWTLTVEMGGLPEDEA